MQSTFFGAMLHQLDGMVNWTSSLCSSRALNSLAGVSDASVMFMCLDTRLIRSSPGTTRDSSNLAKLSMTSVIVLGTTTDACNQYNISDVENSRLTRIIWTMRIPSQVPTCHSSCKLASHRIVERLVRISCENMRPKDKLTEKLNKTSQRNPVRIKADLT